MKNSHHLKVSMEWPVQWCYHNERFVITINRLIHSLLTVFVFASIPYIACDVCLKAVNELYRLTVESRDKAFKHRLEEVSIVEHMENICKPDNATAGKWIRRQDIVSESGWTCRWQSQLLIHVDHHRVCLSVPGSHLLRLIEPGGVSKCKEECVTIAKSCDLLFEEEIEELDDLSALLCKNKDLTVEQLQVS